MASFKPEMRAAIAKQTQFLTKCGENKFHRPSNYFGSNGRLKRKISRPRTDTEEVHEFRMGSYFKQRGSTSVKMDVQQLPQELCTTLGSNMTIVEELQRIREEQRRTEEEQWNPNVDLRWRSAGTYRCGVTAEVRRVSLVTSG